MNHILETKLSGIKLLALDVDGVLTDGGTYFSENGMEMKRFNVQDGLGLKLVLKAGIEIAFISSSDSKATLHRANKLGIKHIYCGVEDKLSILETLCKKLNLLFSQVVYVGDDLVDLPVLKAVGCPMTVNNAISDIKEVSLYVTKKDGGTGAVREICELLLSNNS